MSRRVTAVLAAVLLAVVGGVLLLRYVAGADARALAGLETRQVLVVRTAVAEGTATADLGDAVTLKTLPALAVVPGSVSSVAELDGLVTTTRLEPGEQLLASRFADPATLSGPAPVTVPKGLHQVSLQLEPERVVGGTLTAGARVGVFLSTEDADTTALALHKVLVTAVSGGAAPAPADGGDASTAPAQAVMVTLALDGRSAEKLVFAAEHGTVWLSAEPTDAPAGRMPVVTKENLSK